MSHDLTASGEAPFHRRTPRVVAAVRLHRRAERERAGQFLVEGPQAVREAAARPELLRELFGTPAALHRHADLVARAAGAGARISPVDDAALAALAGTVTPQGLVAVCATVDVPLPTVVAGGPRLVAVLAEIRDPGNAGTILRTADAAGAAAVVFAGDAVDPYNGKCVRASAGSLFHVAVVRGIDVAAAMTGLRAAGLQILAADGRGETDLDDAIDAGLLLPPTAWLFGSEAHGLHGQLAVQADARVRVPILGRAESLNLAAAAAVCLYASSRAQRPRHQPARH
jgi:TrmH family RNA methyltransferase